MSDFKPQSLPLLIGSVPLDDHRQAAELIFSHTPEVPIWPQLTVYKEEGMIPQFLTGFPGVDSCDGKTFINSTGATFDEEFLSFFEEYLMVIENAAPLEGSRFALTPEVAKGFFEFIELAKDKKSSLVGLKGQITGPITFCTGVVDQDGRAIFYNEQLRDAAVKMLALKGQYQARMMGQISKPSFVFFDEPGLSGFGSSAFITISKEDITNCFSEVFEAVQAEGCLAGVHVCANTEWSLLFDAGIDVISYDAYGFFDKLILYKEHLLEFIGKGGILATGIVPTSPELIDGATVDALVELWYGQVAELERIGISKKAVFEQSFITPSCGTGTVSVEQAVKVLELTRDVSKKIRESMS